MASYVLVSKDFKYEIILVFIFTLLPFLRRTCSLVHNDGQVLKNEKYLYIISFPVAYECYIYTHNENFMKSIPDAIFESAKLDGAGDFTIFINLVLPLSKPALATIGLFIALNY